MPTMTYAESGTDATQDLVFYGFTSGTVASATDQSYTGPRSLKCSTGSPAATALAQTVSGILADTGRRISYRFQFNSNINAAFVQVSWLLQVDGSTSIQEVRLRSDGRLDNRAFGATTATGTAVLVPNTWYRITVSYTITNTTTFRFDIYVNGVLDSSVTAGTLTNTGTSIFRLSSVNTAGDNFDSWFDDIYVDDGADYTDPGDTRQGGPRVTAKRPFSNGTTNGFTTQIGAGGSGYGSGHAPQVNEQPLNTANGWSMIGAGAAVTEEYNIEDEATGDVNLRDKMVRGKLGWVYAKALAAETAQIIVDGVNSNISLTTSNKLFIQDSSTGTYPAGTGADIGIITSTDLTTVSLYEAGILVVFLDLAGGGSMFSMFPKTR